MGPHAVGYAGMSNIGIDDYKDQDPWRRVVVDVTTGVTGYDLNDKTWCLCEHSARCGNRYEEVDGSAPDY